jgi:hypothetical protein
MPQREPGNRAANVRTALVLWSIAAAFFLGVILKYYLLR